MTNMNFYLLIIGFFDSIYIIQFVKLIKKKCPEAHLYYWGYKPNTDVTDKDYLNCYDEFFFFESYHKMRFPIFRKIESIIQFRCQFKKFVSQKHFDYVNIHFVRPEYYLIINFIKKYSSRLLLSPWGSDVYRFDPKFKFVLKRLYAASDFVTGGTNRFTCDFMRLFNIPQNKIVNCTLGADIIDYIADHKNIINYDRAKKLLGIESSYVITCGYNAMAEQQHEAIIESIFKVKKNLPDDLLLLFPFTYPNNPDYVSKVKEKVSRCGLKALYYENFMDIPDLFLLRQATDMFVHVQITDAGSISVKEYILCGKTIVNGSWLKYPELEKNGHCPYFEVDNMHNLSQVILKAYSSERLEIDEETIEVIEQRRWSNAIDSWIDLFANVSNNN